MPHSSAQQAAAPIVSVGGFGPGQPRAVNRTGLAIQEVGEACRGALTAASAGVSRPFLGGGRHQPEASEVSLVLVPGPLRGDDAAVSRPLHQTLPLSLSRLIQKGSFLLSAAKTCRAAITVQVFQFTRALEIPPKGLVSWSIKPSLKFRRRQRGVFKTSRRDEDVDIWGFFPFSCVCDHFQKRNVAFRSSRDFQTLGQWNKGVGGGGGLQLWGQKGTK